MMPPVQRPHLSLFICPQVKEFGTASGSISAKGIEETLGYPSLRALIKHEDKLIGVGQNKTEREELVGEFEDKADKDTIEKIEQLFARCPKDDDSESSCMPIVIEVLRAVKQKSQEEIKEHVCNVHYVLLEPAKEEKVRSNDQVTWVLRDKDRDHETLATFAEKEEARESNLQ
jgi:hypothetical protein